MALPLGAADDASAEVELLPPKMDDITVQFRLCCGVTSRARTNERTNETLQKCVVVHVIDDRVARAGGSKVEGHQVSLSAPRD